MVERRMVPLPVTYKTRVMSFHILPLICRVSLFKYWRVICHAHPTLVSRPHKICHWQCPVKTTNKYEKQLQTLQQRWHNDYAMHLWCYQQWNGKHYGPINHNMVSMQSNFGAINSYKTKAICLCGYFYDFFYCHNHLDTMSTHHLQPVPVDFLSSYWGVNTNTI